MKQNEKPQGFNLGHRNYLDGESITENVTPMYRQIPNEPYVFGKSSPLITAYDICETAVLVDSDFCTSYSRAENHLRSLGLTPVFNRKDQIRFHSARWKESSWRRYAGAR